MQALLLICVGVLLIPTALTPASTLMTGLPAPAGDPFGVSGGCGPQDYGPWLWICYFTVWVQQPNLVFFRWDFEGDGFWDTPWVSTFAVSHQSSDIGVRKITVQGWDGVSTWNGEPIGPLAFKNLVLGGDLEFAPDAWPGSTAGWELAGWEFPSAFQPPPGRAAEARVYMVSGSTAIPAIALPRSPHPGPEPVAARFRVDRSALSQVVGPGTHAVFMWGRWGSYDFATLPTSVTIL